MRVRRRRQVGQIRNEMPQAGIPYFERLGLSSPKFCNSGRLYLGRESFTKPPHMRCWPRWRQVDHISRAGTCWTDRGERYIVGREERESCVRSLTRSAQRASTSFIFSRAGQRKGVDGRARREPCPVLLVVHAQSWLAIVASTTPRCLLADIVCKAMISCDPLVNLGCLRYTKYA